MLTSFWVFHLRRGFYIQLVAKVIATWLLLYDVHIPLMHIKVFWNILRVYLYIHEFNYLVFKAY